MRKFLLASMLVSVVALSGCSVLTETTTDEKEITEDFSNISIEVSYEDITFYESEDDVTRVTFVHPEACTTTIEVKNNTLVVKEKTPMFSSIGTSEGKLEIYLPAGEYSNLDIDCASANTNISRFEFESIDIDCASGNVTLDDMSLNTIEIDAASGDIYISDVSANRIEIDTASGDINLSNVISEYMEFNTASGNVTFDECDANNIDIDTASGDVTGTLLTSKDFDVDTASGSIDTPNDGGNGSCKIDTASGDVSIRLA